MNQLRSPWVKNYEDGADIQVISGDLDLSALKFRLLNTYERYLATLYFNRRSTHLAQSGDEILAIWFFRAALAHFQGIFELVNADIPSGCKQIWKRSDIRKNLYAHDLIYTMTRFRNIALHTDKMKCSMQDREVIFVPGGVQDVTYLFFSPISSDHFDNKVNNLTIIWFNRQAKLWSAHALLEESCFILMLALDNFVRMNKKNFIQASDALDRLKSLERAFACN